MDRYPLVSALSRPVIVKHLVEAARKHGATRGRARLHRQGQRPGALRGRHRRARAGPAGARPGPRLRHDPGQGDRLRRGEGPADRRRPRSRRTPSTRTSGAARSRPASSRTSGTARSRTSTTTPPTRPCRARPTRSSSPSTQGVPVAIDGQPVTVLQAVQRAQPAGRRAGRRPARHGRGPARRHQEPRGLRGAGRDRADHRAPGAGERHRRARPGPVQAARSSSAGASSSTTACGSPRSSGPWTASSTRRTSTSPATSG